MEEITSWGYYQSPKDEYFSADLLLLSSSYEDGICYVKTTNLDGESNMKACIKDDVVAGIETRTAAWTFLHGGKRNSQRVMTGLIVLKMATQDSPFSSFIRNLSPIQPLKAASVAQGFPGLHSPPFVFSSPRINPNSQQNILKRPPFPQASGSENSGNDDFHKGNAGFEHQLGGADKLQSLLIPGDEKSLGKYNESADDQFDSPSACADDFLADIEVHSVDSEKSDIYPGGSDEFPQSLNSLNNTNECILNGIRKDEAANDYNISVIRQADAHDQEKPMFDLKAARRDRKQGDRDEFPNPHPTTEHNWPADNANHQQNSVTEIAHGAKKIASDGASNLQSDSYETYCETEGAMSSTSVGSKIQESKAGQVRRGTCRRCLQFEDAQQRLTANSPASLNPPSSLSDPKCDALAADSKVVKKMPGDITTTSNQNPLLQLTQPNFSNPNSGASTITNPKPSGIGLHLNSIVNAMQVGGSAIVSMKSSEGGNLCIRGKGPLSNSYHPSKDSNNHSILLNVAENVPASVTDCRPQSGNTGPDRQALVIPNRATLASFDEIYSSSEIPETIEHHSNPRYKRKKMDIGDGDGCKRCNCRKSKCLKLYCDCFAAGIYCAGFCACQGCLNRPEYEDTVLETRQQVESRKPDAFAPKVVERSCDASAISVGDVTQFTPSSARHKSGCSCKKSMCQKKYCECYQANVGCSDGCRCEGCKNIYCTKEEYGQCRDSVSRQGHSEQLDVHFNKELVVPSGNVSFQTQLYPDTPSLQCPTGGNEESKVCFLSGGYSESPESALTFTAPYGSSQRSLGIKDNHDMIQGTSNEILDLVTYDQELDFGNIDSVHGSPFIGASDNHLVALPNSREWTNSSNSQLISSGGSSSSNSSYWHSSSITPVTRLGAHKCYQVAGYVNKSYDLKQDDTPEILRDTFLPLNAVKVSSPNKKRISPLMMV